MRITQGIIHRSFLINLDNINEKLNKKFQQISSGKRITRPSDDPVTLSNVMQLKDSLKRIDQYKKNIEDAISWLNMTESAFNSMENILNRLEEIAISMGSDNSSPSMRKTAAEEVARIKEQALMIANTKFKGRYIFSGFLTDTAPFTTADNNYHGDENSLEVEVDDGLKISYNVAGSLFTNGVNIFQLMDDLKSALNNNDTDAIKASIDKIHDAYNRINITHAGIGAKIKTLKNMKDELSDRSFSFEKIISQKEDVDMTEAIPKLYIYQTAYQALLNSFAKITSINLFNIIG